MRKRNDTAVNLAPTKETMSTEVTGIDTEQQDRPATKGKKIHSNNKCPGEILIDCCTRVSRSIF